MDEAAKSAPVSQDDEAKAEAWMNGHFFKKKGMPGAVGDEWREITAACKAFGLKQGESWRDWVYSRWIAGGEAKAAVIRMLKVAGMIPGSEPVSKGGALKDEMKAVIAELKKADLNLDDLVAKLGPKIDQTVVDKLLDGGFIYEVPSKPGRFAVREG